MNELNLFMNFMAIGMAVILLIILLLILKRGVVDVSEPRKPVLVLEILMMFVLIGLGMFNIADFLWL